MKLNGENNKSRTEKNKRLLEDRKIEEWQYCLRENVPIQSLPNNLNNHIPPFAPKWAGGLDKTPDKSTELTWDQMESIEAGIQTGHLLPYEAAMLFGIQGEKIKKFLQELKYTIPPHPKWILNWAQPEPTPKYSTNNSGLSLYLASIPKYEGMTAEEETALIQESRSPDPTLANKAEEKLILANLRLVVAIARKSSYNNSIEDLIAEGNIGLRTAIQKYKPDMGARLSTYAAWWIKQSIRKALNDSKTIRIPLHQQHNLKKIQDTIYKLTEITGANPSDEEIAEETGIKTHIVHRLRNLTTPMLSLQHFPNDETNGKSYEETLKDTSPNGANPLEKLSDKHAQETLEKILVSRLNAQEQRVINLRFGMENESPKTLDETGEILNLTRERIRQIQDGALKKLKKSLIAHRNLKGTLAYLKPTSNLKAPNPT